MSRRSQTRITPRMVQVIARQLGYVKRQVLLAREDVVSLSVIVHKERHVARHLTGAEVTLHYQALSYCLTPGRCPPLLKVSLVQRIHHSHGLLVKLHRPGSCIGPLGIEELIRSFRLVGHSNTIAGGIVPLTLQFQVEPHAELPRYLIIYNLRAFQHTSPLYVVSAFIRYAQRHTAVAPVPQVLRGIACHAHQGAARMFCLVFTEPVVRIAVLHYTSAVGVYVIPVLIRPYFTGTDTLCISTHCCQHTGSQHSKKILSFHRFIF